MWNKKVPTIRILGICILGNGVQIISTVFQVAGSLHKDGGKISRVGFQRTAIHSLMKSSLARYIAKLDLLCREGQRSQLGCMTCWTQGTWNRWREVINKRKLQRNKIISNTFFFFNKQCDKKSCIDEFPEPPGNTARTPAFYKWQLAFQSELLQT